MSALYNEIEAYPAQWMRNLIAAGHIAPGEVIERSIKDVHPSQVARATQVHLFAGIGIWSHALRAAGWADETSVWTASCPCQPFSSAGRGEGTEDPRHLWPDAFRLINACRPPIVLGEQVGSDAAVGEFRAGTRKRAPSASGDAWIDLVRTDLERAGYAVGFLVFPAAGVGAPHMRHRLYFAAISQDGLAHHHHQQGRGQFGSVVPEDGNAQPGTHADGRGATGGLADAEQRLEWGRAGEASDGRDAARLESERLRDARRGLAGSEWMGDADGEHPRGDAGAGDCAEGRTGLRSGGHEPRASGAAGRLGFAGFAGLQGHAGHGNARSESRRLGADAARPTPAPGPTNGRWADVEWLPCRDEKWRPTEPGLFPLAHGAPQRVGRLCAYGNGLVAAQAEEFIKAVMGLLGAQS